MYLLIHKVSCSAFEIVMNGRQFIIPELAGNGLNGANSCVHKILFNCLKQQTKKSEIRRRLGDGPRRCSNFQVDSRFSFERKGILGMIQRKLIDKALWFQRLQDQI